jgi:LmbE family N-acetylglucosaminyl deacetylase
MKGPSPADVSGPSHLGGPAEQLRAMTPVLAVCAHPDDESFGLGAILAALTAAGAVCSLMCFTRGEASTLGTPETDLGHRRAGELQAAAAVLGVTRADLLDYPDGALADVCVADLAQDVRRHARSAAARTLLVFDDGGITGHPDHIAATAAALLAAAQEHLTVLAWTIPAAVATTLNTEFDTTFVGRSQTELDFELPVDRTKQRAAIACHGSQSTENPVLWRRLQLLGDTEHLRYLNPHS